MLSKERCWVQTARPADQWWIDSVIALLGHELAWDHKTFLLDSLVETFCSQTHVQNLIQRRLYCRVQRHRLRMQSSVLHVESKEDKQYSLFCFSFFYIYIRQQQYYWMPFSSKSCIKHMIFQRSLTIFMVPKGILSFVKALLTLYKVVSAADVSIMSDAVIPEWLMSRTFTSPLRVDSNWLYWRELWWGRPEGAVTHKLDELLNSEGWKSLK